MAWFVLEGASGMSIQIAILGRVVRPGMRFQHSRRVLSRPDGTGRPAICTVTAIRRGVVHYRDETGLLAASYPSEFVNDVGQWLVEAA
jgi:hypothetical protein